MGRQMPQRDEEFHQIHAGFLATVRHICKVVLGMQRFGVGLMIERSLVRLPAGALSSQLCQLSLPSLRGT